MKLRDDFVQELKSLVGQTNHQVSVSDGLRTIRCKVLQCDPLGAAISDLVLETGELATADIAKLETASKSLCGRVTYLLEPISPIEIDSTGCVVQMRSNPPHKDDNGLKYYELTLRQGGSVSLTRYEKQPANSRLPVPATLTHEVLSRLVEDFSIAVDEVLPS
ncbi:hypothetical protein [Bythopirellula polymerisocia]|uniref:Uncharacterized protein n=1 Tax=Bythopirellula polymerisocia TaxID=2528003 RepID=A0A5C6CBN5_9BACT|nr:hypothetical protein [Bythopirellula polymerisocia]TWU21247.1 hypothetical protein Pla144_46560 [Bythopirellula polymerisocia]